VRRLAAAAVGVTLLVPAAAQAIDYAPVDQPGPPLRVPQDKLDASLACSGDPSTGPTPILLVHGTAESPKTEFSWNWEPALTGLGIPWCAVALPDNGLDDAQVAGEYVVNGIRTLHARAGRRIDVIGHSQGGMLPRWGFRFWPDTRSMVDDLVGLSPSNHGTLTAVPVCAVVCPASFHQQAAGSQFLAALNSSQETFAGISYTTVYTHTDWVVTPNLDDTGSSSLHTGDGRIRNVAIQQVCPLDVNEHLGVGTYDPVAWALAVDAITHGGPADPARIPASVCTQLLMPGVNPATFATDEASFAAAVAGAIAAAPQIPAEPPLACYVTASCPASGSVESAGATTPTTKKCKKGKHRKHGKCVKKGKKKR
jgi:pimeloyl-ACP methyl ester carboxylesterase